MIPQYFCDFKFLRITVPDFFEQVISLFLVNYKFVGGVRIE